MRKAEAHLVLPMVADVIAVSATLKRPATTINGVGPFDLFTNAVDERDESIVAKDATYSILHQFPGVEVTYEPNQISVQSYTLAKTAALALARSASIFNALIDDDGFPRRGWIVGPDGNQYECDVFSLIEGGVIGVDPRGRYEAVFNFELAYRKVGS